MRGSPGRDEFQSGFALVVTVSLLTLVAVIAMGLLTLSAVALRTATRGAAAAEARANARLALLLSLGEIQKLMGPDQNINAPSDILGAESDGGGVPQGRLTGVWHARNDELGDEPDYDRAAPFRRWLVSHPDQEELKKLDFATGEGLKDPIEMVGSGTLGIEAPDTLHVRASRIPVQHTAGPGRLAWWVGDENSKALANPLDLKARAGAPGVADALAGFATPGAHGIQAVEDLETVATNTEAGDKAVSHGQMRLFFPEEIDSQSYFHDFTPHARSVLANVTSGGLRKDLNLYLERSDIRWTDSWPRNGGPRGPLGPNGEIALSPPDEYDVLSWKHLYHHYHSHRMVHYRGGRPTLTALKATSRVDPVLNPSWNSGVTRPAVFPIRVQVFMSYGTIRQPGSRSNYQLVLYMYPVLTMWNPFNVDIQVDEYHILLNAMPLKHRILVDGREKAEYTWRMGRDNQRGSGTTLGFKNQTFRAGESKSFSPVDWWPERGIRAHYLHEMKPVPFAYGQRSPGSRWGIGDKGVSDPPLRVTGTAGQKITIESRPTEFTEGDGAFRFLQTTFGWRGQDVFEGDGRWPTYLWSSKVGWRYENRNPRPDNFSTNNASGDTFGALFDAPRPLCVVDARLKALDEDRFPNKAWVQTIPCHPYGAATSQRQGGDSHSSYFTHPYALSFRKVNSYHEAARFAQRVPGDPVHGFFGASYQPDGQTYITGRELPLVPLSSLAQLQNLPPHPIDAMHWSGHHFQNNAIGNSFANPGIPAAKIKTPWWPFYLNGYINDEGGWLDGRSLPKSAFVPAAPNIDRSYAANHLLWDDYFFSSMGDQSGSFFQRFGTKRKLRDVVEEFYGGTSPLPNARYMPHLASGRSAEEISEELIGNSGTPTADGHAKVAANLMVAGGFNVNSTSVPAWTAMLASAHLKHPVVLDSRSSSGPGLEPEGKFVVSRFTMPNGPAAIDPGDEEQRWRGYRELSETEIRQLAEAIVRQVRRRGPFRSLGEFVNRRLEEYDETSLYGALQAALEDPDVDVNASYRGFDITRKDFADASYAYPEAAEGSRYQGTPAYVTQADLLQSMAPVINARSDTFIIRAYGESLSRDGKEVLARAWCEAVVQRYPEYLVPTDDPEVRFSDLKEQVNRRFGRRFAIRSFRWIKPEEV